MISKIQISISEENEEGIRTFTLSGELPKQTTEVTLGSHIADLIDSLLRREGNSSKPQPENGTPTHETQGSIPQDDSAKPKAWPFKRLSPQFI